MPRKFNDYYNSFSKFFCCFMISTALGTGFYYTTVYFTNSPSQNIPTTISLRTTLPTFQQPTIPFVTTISVLPIVTTIPVLPIVTTIPVLPIVTTIPTQPIVTTIPVQQTTKTIVTTIPVQQQTKKPIVPVQQTTKPPVITTVIQQTSSILP